MWSPSKIPNESPSKTGASPNDFSRSWQESNSSGIEGQAYYGRGAPSSSQGRRTASNSLSRSEPDERPESSTVQGAIRRSRIGRKESSCATSLAGVVSVRGGALMNGSARAVYFM